MSLVDVKHKPQPKIERSCVACGAKDAADSLFRVTVTPDSQLVFDLRRKLGGRGAYVCSNGSCIEAAIVKRRFEKTLKTKVAYPTAEVFLEMAREIAYRNLTTLFGSGVGARLFVSGTDAVMGEISKKKVFLLFLAKDFSNAQNFVDRSKKENIPVKFISDKALLGELIQRRATGVVAVLDKGFASALESAVTKYESIEK